LKTVLNNIESVMYLLKKKKT